MEDRQPHQAALNGVPDYRHDHVRQINHCICHQCLAPLLPAAAIGSVVFDPHEAFNIWEYGIMKFAHAPALMIQLRMFSEFDTAI
jgi:hypothetical protein